MTKTTLESTSPLIEIEMLPAGHGDSLLISANMRDNKKVNLLIDCGFAYTYRDVIKKRLLELTERGEHLSRLIITHIDADPYSFLLSRSHYYL